MWYFNVFHTRRQYNVFVHGKVMPAQVMIEYDTGFPVESGTVIVC